MLRTIVCSRGFALHHWLPDLSSGRLPRLLAALVLGACAYGLLAPLLAVGHELVVLGTAAALREAAWVAGASSCCQWLPLDPTYTSAMLLTVAGIVPRGLAVAGLPGDLLHASWPSLFESSALVAPMAAASAVVEPGATVISRWICEMVADTAIVGVGLLAIRWGRARHRWLVVLGAVIQANIVIAHLIDAPLDAPRGHRANLFREQWSTIRARTAYVLGGAAYVWSTDGPETVDRAFGLVDEEARPVDDALAAISDLYLADALDTATHAQDRTG